MRPEDLKARTFISARRTSGELGVSMSTLANWRNLGVGPKPVYVTPRHIVYSLTDVLNARKNGVHGIAKAIARKRASQPLQLTPAAARMAVARRARWQKRYRQEGT